MEALTVGNIWDIVLAAFFLFLIVRGYCAGLVLQAAQLAVLFASVVTANLLAKLVGIPALSVAFFLAAFLLYWKLIQVVKIVDLLPVVGTLDRLLGAAAGFCIAFLICYIVFGFLDDIIAQKVWNSWGLTKKMVKETYLLQVFLR